MTTPMMPLCHVCKNLLQEYPWKCKAFPNKIPEKIITMESDHRREFHGDQGIRFEPLEIGVGYAEVVFGK